MSATQATQKISRTRENPLRTVHSASTSKNTKKCKGINTLYNDRKKPYLGTGANFSSPNRALRKSINASKLRNNFTGSCTSLDEHVYGGLSNSGLGHTRRER